MRWGIFSDVHSNLEALQAVVKAYKPERVDTYLCLGDIVGYGANPLECIQITREISRNTIAGNHDRATAGLFSLEYFNHWAKEAVLWTRQRLDSPSRNFLASLQLINQNDDFILVHGSLNQPEEFNYIFDLFEASATFSLLERKICFIGHTHIAGAFIQDRKQKAFYQNEVSLKLRQDYRYIINVGSVGQPRDGNNQASYCVFDSEKQEVAVKRIDYDIKSAQEKILAAGLPPLLASRLSAGR
ncbi:metallophosphoesterase family protein [Candidatus Omnitrophota bacterium]